MTDRWPAPLRQVPPRHPQASPGQTSTRIKKSTHPLPRVDGSGGALLVCTGPGKALRGGPCFKTLRNMSSSAWGVHNGATPLPVRAGGSPTPQWRTQPPVQCLPHATLQVCLSLPPAGAPPLRSCQSTSTGAHSRAWTAG